MVEEETFTRREIDKHNKEATRLVFVENFILMGKGNQRDR
jgi:hypothetical protein